MKTTKVLWLLILAFAITSFQSTTKTTSQPREFYQLKTYILHSDEQVQATDKYLKEAYLPGLKRLGIKNIGVFKPKPNVTDTDTLKKIIVVIPFKSIDQFLNLDEKLAKDKLYLVAGADYLNANYKQAPYLRIESILLKAFVEHPFLTTPNLDSPRLNRVYELRSYESATEVIHANKVDMFNAGGEVKLFNRLEFNAVFYGQVISGAKMPNLMYMTTFKDQESRDAHWKAFSDSPEWKGLIAMEKYKNNISHIDITFLYPTDYSDY
tara:strand:- start:8694 stop:9491 length:798 start_codon:yes stop_codon:yes gene_type:complete